MIARRELPKITQIVEDRIQRLIDQRVKPHVAPAPGRLDDLRMLAELHERGVLTDAEYLAKTKDVLAAG